MSDAIKNAIEAMEFAQHAVGPFNRVATKKLRESIAELQAAQAQAVNQQLLEAVKVCASFLSDFGLESSDAYQQALPAIAAAQEQK